MTKREFREMFPDERACVTYVLNRQLEKGFKCVCGSVDFCWRRSGGRFYCVKCYSTASVFRGTIFYNSHIKLMDWFEVIYQFAVSKNGLSAKEVERMIGCSYRIAWAMLNKIRSMLNEEPEFGSNSQIEIDETYIGGSPKNWRKNKRELHKLLMEKGLEKGLTGASTIIKNAVIGFYERESEKVLLKHIPLGSNVNQKEILNYLLEKFVDSNIFYTDESRIYNGLYNYYEHYSVDHSKNEHVFYKKKKDTILKVSTNSIESFWAIVKRAIKGCYIHISTKHFSKYLNEFAFKFNNKGGNIFNCVMQTII